MFGALFVLGDNDTMLETVGILAIGITAIPGSLLALRYRRLAAVILAFAAVLWIIGVLDGNAYLAKKYGTQIMFRDQIRSLLKVTGAPLFLAVFYMVTDLLKWPLLTPHDTSQKKLEAKG